MSSPKYVASGSTPDSQMETSEQDQYRYPQHQELCDTQLNPNKLLEIDSVFNAIQLGFEANNAGLLDIVDQLRESRAGRYVDLPVVVAVGEQSSGKSSVLKALTGIPFPTSSVQCTRFATEIRLRRTPNAKHVTTRVFIQADNIKRDQQRYDAFASQFSETVVFCNIFARAEAHIFQHDRVNFLSRDRLIIERSGPGLAHLTIIDLPGIIHNPGPNRTEADVDTVSKLFEDYMKKESTIILAVVGADIQYAKQVIIRRCKDFDPTGKRTLGVITKPDMTPEEHINQEFLDLANNKDKHNQILLGWYVLRNSAKDERNSAEERDEAERAFFASSRWGTEISTGNLGIDALRGKISNQVIRHVAREIGHVELEIEALLVQCHKKLEEIGYGWDTTQKMRDALFKFCTRSRDLINLAVRGEYYNPMRDSFFPPYAKGDGLDVRRLRACVVNENLQFGEVMEMCGTEYIIGDGPSNIKPVIDDWSAKYDVMIKSTTRDKFVDEYVKPLMNFGRSGEGLIDYNPELIYTLYQTYSSNWSRIAEKHVGIIQLLCENFLDQVVQYVWPSGTQARIWRDIVKKQLDARLRSAHDVLQELKDDRFRLVQTYDSNYRTTYYRLRPVDSVEDEQTKYEDILDKMLLHYQHQLPTFINNVIMQVVERKLVQGMNGIFDFVHDLTDLEVERLMGDDSETVTKRRILMDELLALQRGLEICRVAVRESGYKHTATNSPVPAASQPSSERHTPSRPSTASSIAPAAALDAPFNPHSFIDYSFDDSSASSLFANRTRPSSLNATKVDSSQGRFQEAAEHESPHCNFSDAEEDHSPQQQAQRADLQIKYSDLTSSEQATLDNDVHDTYSNEQEVIPEAEVEALRERKKKRAELWTRILDVGRKLPESKNWRKPSLKRA